MEGGEEKGSIYVVHMKIKKSFFFLSLLDQTFCYTISNWEKRETSVKKCIHFKEKILIFFS